MATSNDNGEVVVHSKSRSWSSEANWTVSGGSIDNLITVESMDSPIDFEEVDTNDKSPLVLIPPSSDSGPCEIKINFSQKHEVRQVYVRSTARIFEIYLAPSLRSNEYLCTVRCGIAARDDGVLHATLTGEHGANSDGSAGKRARGRSSDEGNTPVNEDDWIEVKVPDSSSQDNQHNSMPRNDNHNQEASCQDLYEATAEITDADACISLTLRLLSLQTKGWVYVDEIYVFADPVDSADTETQVPEVGSSAGTSLMAMLVPTLLNLSKSGNFQKQNKQTSDPKEGDDSQGIPLHVPHSTFAASEIRQEEFIGTRQEVTENTRESPHLQIPGKAADTGQEAKLDSERNMPYNQIARTLELLISRVSRIEDICSSFEQSMLKPISSIEGRLQRVEEQVQMLSNNAQRSAVPPCPSTRIAAPSFSCTGTNVSSSNDEGSAENAQPSAMRPLPSTRFSAPSFSCTNSSSFNDEGNNYPACGVLQSGKRDSPVEVSSNPDVDSSIPVLVPGLVVTAPEFSCSEDEESDDDFEPKEDCPKEIKKQGLSIDDALAAALAGFISATSAPPSHDVPTLTVKAPEFTVDEGSDDSTLASPSAALGGFGSATSAPHSQYVQTLTVKAPEFTVDEEGDGPTLVSPSAAPAGFISATSAPASNYVQTLTVKAPEFTVDEDGDDSTLPCPSAAIAGSISAFSAPPSQYVQALMVKAPEFSVDDDGDDITLALPSAQSGQEVPYESDPPRYVNESASSSSSIPALPATVHRMADSRDNFLEDTFEGFAQKVQFDDKDTRGCSPGITIDRQTTQPELRLAQTDDSRIVEVTSKGEAADVFVVSNSERSDILQQVPGVPIEDTCKTASGSATETADDVVEGSEEAGEDNDASIVSKTERSDILQQFPGVLIEDTCKTANGSAAEIAAEIAANVVEGFEEATSKGEEDNDASIVSTSEKSNLLQPGVSIEDACKTVTRCAAETADDVVKGSEEETSADAVKSSSTSCTVNFEFPILDVKCASSGLPTADSHVETLLADMPENKVETHCLLQREGNVDGKDLQKLLVDWDSDYVNDVLAGAEGEEGSVNAFTCEQETSFSLI